MRKRNVLALFFVTCIYNFIFSLNHLIDKMTTWQNGRLMSATQYVSPNYCAREKGEKIHLIVLHNISLAPFTYGSDAVMQLFTNTLNPRDDPFFEQLRDVHVSSHFFVRRDGEIVQFVSCDDMAYHAGVSQFRGREKCNAFSIGIEIEGCDFEPFTDKQYAALNQLMAHICKQYPIDAITGHQDIAPTRKSDPGHFFDWQRLTLQHLVVHDNENAA